MRLFFKLFIPKKSETKSASKKAKQLYVAGLEQCCLELDNHD